MRLAVIPARGGSKRIPRKNIRDFFGKPMIAWSIEAAIASKCFDRIIVSTDDEEIAETAKAYGAEVPFLRPLHLSNDYIGLTAVVTHATEWALSKNMEVKSVCCILATAPFILFSDIKKGLTVLKETRCSYVFTATDYASPIFRSFKQNLNGDIEMFFPNHFNTRSQDLPNALHDAAQFYWGQSAAWIEGSRVFSKNSKLIMIPRWRVQDIDTEDDLKRAELIASLIRK
jgi:N-acylneuraminate cytidylyltransferase